MPTEGIRCGWSRGFRLTYRPFVYWLFSTSIKRRSYSTSRLSEDSLFKGINWGICISQSRCDKDSFGTSMKDKSHATVSGLRGNETKARSDLMALNDVIAEVVFGMENSGLPVHLDFDARTISRVGAKYELSDDLVMAHVVGTVIAASPQQTPASLFKFFADETRRWQNLRITRREERIGLTPPPALGLLALLSFAADQMRYSADDGQGAVILANNYYTRLLAVIDLDWPSDDLQTHYRLHAVGIWQSLHDWLEEWEGERGLCTVPFPGKTKHHNWAIQMPISQALLRTADEENLFRMFESRGLNPGIQVTPELMSFMLEEWCGSYGTRQMKEIWRKSEYRSAMVASAQKSFENWDGPAETGDDAEVRVSSQVRLVLDFNSFSKQVQFGIDVFVPSNQLPSSVEILTEGGDKYSVEVWPGGPRTVRIVDTTDFETESLLSGILSVSNVEVGISGKRHPRKVAVFEASQFGRAYSEVGNVLLGAPHGILIRNDENSPGTRTTEVEALLGTCAQPGWKTHTSSTFKGIPEGWAFIEDVVFVSYPGVSLHSDLRQLAPVEIDSLRLAGGFRIPGRRPRWLLDALPTATAIFPDAQDVSILVRNSAGEIVLERSVPSSVLVQPLEGLPLTVGLYEVTATTNDQRFAKLSFQLVDAETPNPAVLDSSKNLSHVFGESHVFGILSAAGTQVDPGGQSSLRGLDLTAIGEVDMPEPQTGEEIPTEQRWARDKRDSSQIGSGSIRIEKAPRESCVNASHVWVLPTWFGGTRPKYVEGICKHCKFTKQMPGRARPNRSLRSIAAAIAENRPLSTTLDLDEIKKIPPVPSRESGAWNHAFAVICYLRHGSHHQLSQICSQVVTGDVGVDRMVRAFSALGHIDVALDERCRPASWSVSPPVLVQTSRCEAHLAGYRSESLIELLQSRVEDFGGKLLVESIPNGPDRVSIEVQDEAHFEQIIDGIYDDVTHTKLMLQPDATSILLEALPTITDLADDCPEIRVPVSRQLNRWDGHEGRWKPVDNALGSGAYQSIGNGNTYVFNRGTIAPGDKVRCATASAVKHMESLRDGVPLYYYRAESKEMCCRLGAELPGLVARAAVARSGRTPIEDEANHIIRYTNIDLESAKLISRTLGR